MADHPTFAAQQIDEILDFFRRHNYVVLSDTLNTEELHYLNDFIDRSQAEFPTEWRIGDKEVYSHAQLLINYPELDPYVRPRVVFPIVDAIMGPDPRFAQFDFRDSPDQFAKNDTMRFHRDRTEVRIKDPNNENDFECAYVCNIQYLTDVDENTPCFCVVPNSHPYESIEEAQEKMGAAYQEIHIHGPAGTAVLYNIGIYHRRYPGLQDQGRRTQHNYFSRAASPPLTNWVLLPQRLAEHPNPDLRTYYSQWSDATKAFAEAGYSQQFYDDNVMDKPT